MMRNPDRRRIALRFLLSGLPLALPLGLLASLSPIGREAGTGWRRPLGAIVQQLFDRAGADARSLKRPVTVPGKSAAGDAALVTEKVRREAPLSACSRLFSVPSPVRSSRPLTLPPRAPPA